MRIRNLRTLLKTGAQVAFTILVGKCDAPYHLFIRTRHPSGTTDQPCFIRLFLTCKVHELHVPAGRQGPERQADFDGRSPSPFEKQGKETEARVCGAVFSFLDLTA